MYSIFLMQMSVHSHQRWKQRDRQYPQHISRKDPLSWYEPSDGATSQWSGLLGWGHSSSIPKVLIEQPDNSFNHLSSIFAATEASMQFSAVLPMGGSAIASSSQPIPCHDSNSNNSISNSNISKRHFSHWKTPGVSERMWSVHLDELISGEYQTIGGHSARTSE